MTGGGDRKSLGPAQHTSSLGSAQHTSPRCAERETSADRAPRWGTLSGVRPVRLAHLLFAEGCTDAVAAERLVSERGVSRAVADRLVQIARTEMPFLSEDPHRACLYVAIPFCPSRCLYCSFPVDVLRTKRSRLAPYLELLHREITHAVALAARLGLVIDCVYIGGGTPSVLPAEETDRLLAHITHTLKQHAMPSLTEFTWEAGRIDTITDDALAICRSHGVDRLSLNPQTFTPSVQEAVSRPLTYEQYARSVALARTHGFRTINADLIAGLPGETPASFARSLDLLARLEPENITIHALALKRGSKLNEQLLRHHRQSTRTDRGPAAASSSGESRRSGKRGGAAKLEWLPDQGEEAMFDAAEDRLLALGYLSYYLYRQKNIKGGLHNIGYALPGHESRYNIRIIEESHSILGCGVGAVTKLIVAGEAVERGASAESGSAAGAPDVTRRVDERRIPNFSSLEEYMTRFEELLARKENAADE